MSPPRIEFVDHFDVVFVVEIGGRQDAVFAAGLEENDRNHQGSSEIEGMRAGKGEIV